MADERYFLMGCALLSDRNTSGNATDFVDWGETSELELSLSSEVIKAMSTCAAVGSVARKATRMNEVTGKLVLKSRSKEVLSAALFGTVVDVTSGSTSNFSNKSFPTGITAGQTLPLPDGIVGASSLTITDSNGSPATLVAGTDYTADLNNGTVTFLSVSGKTQPFKAAGVQKANVQAVGINTKRTIEKYLRFKGINILENDRPEIIDLYKISLDVAGTVAIKGTGNEDQSFEIPFTCLVDSTKATDAVLGQIGSWTKVG